MTRTVDPNRFAGAVEAATLCEDISLDEDLLARLDARLARNGAAVHKAEHALAEALDNLTSTKNLYNQVLVERDGVHQRLRQSRGLLHPIRRLPLEVLSNVFIAHLSALAVQYEDGSDEQLRRLSTLPYNVAQVSRKWRDAALHTPQLWIYVSVHFSQPSIAAFDSDWVSRLEERLCRSGVLPIQLHIHGYFPHDPNDDLPPDWPYSSNPDLMSPDDLWAPIIKAIPRCKSIRITAYDKFLDFSYTSSLFKQDAHRLETLSVRVQRITAPSGSDEEEPSVPSIYFNMHAPNLRHLEFLHVRLPELDLRGARIYPCVTSARLRLEDNSSGNYVKALLARCPALARIDAEPGYDQPNALSWLSHPTLEHITFESGSAFHHHALPGPETFPRLESITIQRMWTISPLVRTFSAIGPFHAVRRLSLSIQYLDKDMVAALDLLPRLDTIHLRGGTLTPAFVDINTWLRPSAPRVWKCPLLRNVSITDVQEVQPVGGDIILGFLRKRNSSAQDGAHTGFQRFSIGWAAGHPASLAEGFEEQIQTALMG